LGIKFKFTFPTFILWEPLVENYIGSQFNGHRIFFLTVFTQNVFSNYKIGKVIVCWIFIIYEQFVFEEILSTYTQNCTYYNFKRRRFKNRLQAATHDTSIEFLNHLELWSDHLQGEHFEQLYN